MYIVLSDGVVAVWEAWLTLGFFFLLLFLAYGADRFNRMLEKKNLGELEIEEKNKQDELKIKKSQLRNIAKKHGDAIIL